MNTPKRIIKDLMRRTSLHLSGICQLLIVSLSLVHIAIAFIFGIKGIDALIVSDLICVVVYLVPGNILVKKEKFFAFFVLIYITIQVHSQFACVYLGANYGFQLYCVCVIPISFFLFYLCNQNKSNLKFVIVLNSIALFLAVMTRFIFYDNGFRLVNGLNVTALSFSFNMLVCGFMVILFSSLLVYQLCYTDMELEKRAKTLDFLANYDALTKLRNRRNLENILKKELSKRNNKTKTEALCIALGDIDDFKKINDTYGHDCGDIVLMQLSEIFREHMINDNFVGRWGGEEILFLFQVPLFESQRILEDIRTEVCEYVFTYGENEFSTSMTFGLLEVKEKMSADEVLIKVDEKMYEGKNLGKNRIII